MADNLNTLPPDLSQLIRDMRAELSALQRARMSLAPGLVVQAPNGKPFLPNGLIVGGAEPVPIYSLPVASLIPTISVSAGSTNQYSYFDVTVLGIDGYTGDQITEFEVELTPAGEDASYFRSVSSTIRCQPAEFKTKADGTAYEGVVHSIRVRGYTRLNTVTEWSAASYITSDVTNSPTIPSSKLVEVKADKIKSGTITGGQITLDVTGVNGASFIRSSNYGGSTGWSVDGDGNAVFNNLTARGTVASGSTSGQAVVLDATTNSIVWYSSLGKSFSVYGYAPSSSQRQILFDHAGALPSGYDLTGRGVPMFYSEASTLSGSQAAMMWQGYARFVVTTEGTTNGGFFVNDVGGNQLMRVRQSASLSEVTFPQALPSLAGNSMIYNTTSKQIGYSTSSIAHKEEIETMDDVDALAFLKMNPVTFLWRKEVDPAANRIRRASYIVEEVGDVLPNVVLFDDKNGPVGLDTQSMLGYIGATLRYLDRRLTAIEKGKR